MHRPPRLLARKRFWVLPVLLLVFLAGHGAILYYLSSNVVLSAAVLSGAAILLVIRHVGLLGPVYALYRRRRARSE
jgi:hypothetical protein